MIKKKTYSDDHNRQEVKEEQPMESECAGTHPGVESMQDRSKPQKRKATETLVRPWQQYVFPHHRSPVPGLPVKWDWRNVHNRTWVTPSRSQGICGACVAFAVAAAVESHIMIENNDPNLTFDLSEASLFYTANRQCNENDPTYGWYIPEALNFLIEEGICFEENYPFTAKNQAAVFSKGSTRVYRISGYDTDCDRSQMKRWLVEQGPLISMFSVYDNFRIFWKRGAPGIYRNTEGTVSGNHAVLVVGYDDNLGCWICKNSHPRHHGNSGFFKISYGTAGIDNQMYLIQDVYPVDVRDEYRYDPVSLRIVNSGPLGWRLTDGEKTLKYLDNKVDAENALRVARRHIFHGAIGKKNKRPNYRDYIIEYWRGKSGLLYEPILRADSIPYDSDNVVAVDRDSDGWELRCGNQLTFLADDMNDALAALRLMQRNNRVGFIGRKNKRPEPKDYIMTYWE